MRRFCTVGLMTLALAVIVAGLHRADDPHLKPGEVREFEIASGVKMKFCWIPSGEAQLGSPKAERSAVMKQMDYEIEPEFLALEAETVRGKYSTRGFWLGKFPVTQHEWQSVMGSNPSYYKSVESGDVSRLPVERVTWEDCGKFIAELNDHLGGENVFRMRGKFALPNEDEWEYACRGGKGNAHPFYFGDVLNGTQANCDSDVPFGTDTQGPNKKCTTEVGTYEKLAPHPWGLCDMHGNVAQFCENWYDKEMQYHLVRGGSWYNYARGCRSAARGREPKGNYTDSTGLRVCFRPD